MAVTPAVDELAARLLGFQRDEYAAAEPPRELLAIRGSDAWMWARALAVLLQGLSAQAEQNARDILPDQASDDGIARFGNAYGVGRLPGAGARMIVTATGAPATTFTVPVGAALAWTDGTLYDALDTSITTDVSGNAPLNVEATTVGASTTRAAGEALAWVSTPAGLGATAAVASVVVDGRDAETFAGWAQRIIARLRERPSCGSREDFRAWALAFQGYDSRDGWVYPLLRPPASAPGEGTANVLGCCTVVLAGPPQGDAVTNSRVLGGVAGARLAGVEAFINGTVNALGELAEGEQLRPVAAADGNWTVETINETAPYNVTLAVKTSTAAAFSFSHAEAPIDPTSTATTLVLTGDYSATGDDLSGRAVLVNVGTTNYRGGFMRVMLPTGVYSAGSTTFNLTATPLPAAPAAPLFAYPCPGSWASLRSALFAYFDALGPGVATSSVDSTPLPRWPSQDSGGRSTLTLDALRGVAVNVPGIVAAGVLAPSADVEPPRKQVVTLGRLLVVPLV